MTPVSLRRLRDHARMRLTLLRWPGDIVTAIEVLSRLADNAIVHAQPTGPGRAQMTVRLAVDTNDMLLVDVQDPSHHFPDSKAAIAGEKGSGLKYVRLLHAHVTSSLAQDGRTKTVRAVVPPGEVSL